MSQLQFGLKFLNVLFQNACETLLNVDVSKFFSYGTEVPIVV